jgi:hypothetical protein
MDPLSIILMFGLPILSKALFPGGDDNTTTQTTETPAATPFDPAYSMLSPALLSMLMQNYGRLSGAGFPGGKKIGGDMMSDIISQVSGAWPDILAGYGGSATGKTRPKGTISRKTLTSPGVNG